MDSENRVVLTVGGVRHETYVHVLKKIPATRLSRLATTLPNYDPVLNEYIFDRHPEVFQMVLNYYRTGKLHYPINVCGPLFEEELEFWGLDSNQVEPCCWMRYTQFRGTRETLETLQNMKLDKDEKLTGEQLAVQFGFQEAFYNRSLSVWMKLKPQLWALFDEPHSSRLATLINALSSFLVVLSIVIFCLKTHPLMRETALLDTNEQSADVPHATPFRLFSIGSQAKKSISLAELVCNCWFIYELLARMLFCPNLRKFMKSKFTLIDIAAILSFLIDYVFTKTHTLNSTDNNGGIKDLVEFIAIVRIFRLFKLAQHYPGLKILAETFAASGRVLGLVLFTVLLFVALLATLAFYAERLARNPQNQFKSIIHGLWWATVTLTTVGYGDMVPRTLIGKLVAACASLASVLVTAFPVPVIQTNFNNLFSHMKARSKLPKQRRRVLQMHELKPAQQTASNNTIKTLRSADIS